MIYFDCYASWVYGVEAMTLILKNSLKISSYDLRPICRRNWFVNEGNENIRNFIRLKKKKKKKGNKISVQYIFTSFWSGKWFVWPGEGEKKMHDSLIWRKEKREKGRKRETSGSNQGAVSSKRRRIVKEIKSKMRKKRMKKHRWIG